MNTKRWTYRKTLSHRQQAQANELAQSINVNPFLGQLLMQRGINNFEEAKAFFRPSLAQLHNPFLMKDMDKAVTRLLQAFEKQEKIRTHTGFQELEKFLTFDCKGILDIGDHAACGSLQVRQ